MTTSGRSRSRVVLIALFLGVVLLLGGAIFFTSWRLNRLKTGRWTTVQRHLDGAIAGVGIFVAAPLGAAVAVAIVGAPLFALGRRLGWLSPHPGWPADGDFVLALALAVSGALGVSGSIGYSCVRSGRRGVLHGIGVLAFAATTGAATWLSPLTDAASSSRWVSVVLATGVACILGGAALLASEPPEG